MNASSTYQLVGIRPDGTSRSIVEGLLSYDEAARVRTIVLPMFEADEYATVFIKSPSNAEGNVGSPTSTAERARSESKDVPLVKPTRQLVADVCAAASTTLLRTKQAIADQVEQTREAISQSREMMDFCRSRRGSRWRPVSGSAVPQ